MKHIKTTKFFLALTLAATTASAACGTTEDAAPQPDAPPVTNPIPDNPTGGDAIGSWAMRRIYSANAQVPVVGVVTTTSISFSRLTVTADGTARTATDDLCNIVLESSSSLATPSLIPAYIASMPNEVATGALVDGALTLTPPPSIQGAVLVNPATDALPTTASDARVQDQDDDGLPGITVNLQVTGLGAQKLYIVQRLVASWVAQSVGTNRIEGLVDVDAYDQVTIGASNSLFDSDEPVVLNENGNTFTMVRVDAGFTCADLNAAGEADLFGDR